MSLNLSRLKELCNEVVELATKTAIFLHTECENFDLSKIEHKGARDLVSYVDKEAEKIIVKGLSEILPEAGFVTEEGTVDQAVNGLRWVIDPLDGTTNFLHKLPPFSISIALLNDDDILVGVVYEVNLKECFYAYKGGGAFLNGKSINVSSITSLEDSLIVVGFPYNVADKLNAYFDILKELVKVTHGIRRLGSAAVDLAYVACGRFNAYFEFNLKIWDIAAGILIVREAGGIVTNFKGGNETLDGIELVASGGVHSQMLEVINKHWN